MTRLGTASIALLVGVNGGSTLHVKPPKDAMRRLRGCKRLLALQAVRPDPKGVGMLSTTVPSTAKRASCTTVTRSLRVASRRGSLVAPGGTGGLLRVPGASMRATEAA